MKRTRDHEESSGSVCTDLGLPKIIHDFCAGSLSGSPPPGRPWVAESTTGKGSPMSANDTYLAS
jgi:hypothetical protein